MDEDKVSYLDIIDDLGTLSTFLDVCASALNNKEDDCSKDVASALFFMGKEYLLHIEEKLRKI